MRIVHGMVRFSAVVVATILAAATVVVAAPPPTTNAPRAEMSFATVDLTAATSTLPAAPASPEALAAGIAAAVDLGMFDELAPAPGDVCLTCIGELVEGVVDAVNAGTGGLSAGFTRTLYAAATLGAIAAATGMAVTTTLTTAILDAGAEFNQPPGDVCLTCSTATLVGGVSHAVNVGLIGLASGVVETTNAVTDLGAIAANTGHAINHALTSALLAVLDPDGVEPPPGDYCLGCIEFVRGISAAVDTGLAGMAAGVAMAARAVAALSVAAANTAIAINDAISGAIQDALRALGGAEPSTDAAPTVAADKVDVPEEKAATSSSEKAEDPRPAADETASTDRDDSRERRADARLDEKDEKETADTDTKSTVEDDKPVANDTESTPKDDQPAADKTATSNENNTKPTDKDDQASSKGESSTKDAGSDGADSASSSRAATD